MRALLFATLVLSAAPSQAKPIFGMSIGLGEYVMLGQPAVTHAGLYPCWGIYASFPVHKRLNIVPQIAVEVAPETGQWGFIPSLTLDIPVHSRVGVDVIVMLMHNQTGNDWTGAEVLLGFGPGVSVYLGDWSIGANALFFRSLNLTGWAFFPGVGVSRNFP